MGFRNRISFLMGFRNRIFISNGIWKQNFIVCFIPHSWETYWKEDAAGPSSCLPAECRDPLAGWPLGSQHASAKTVILNNRSIFLRASRCKIGDTYIFVRPVNASPWCGSNGQMLFLGVGGFKNLGEYKMRRSVIEGSHIWIERIVWKNCGKGSQNHPTQPAPTTLLRHL